MNSLFNGPPEFPPVPWGVTQAILLFIHQPATDSNCNCHCLLGPWWPGCRDEQPSDSLLAFICMQQCSYWLLSLDWHWWHSLIYPLQLDTHTNINTLRPRQDGCYFADDVLKCIFLNENVRTSLKNSLKFVPMGPINNIQAFVQIMAWRRPSDKPLSEPMLVFVPTHICITPPQWVKTNSKF